MQLTLNQIKSRLQFYYESKISIHVTSAPGRGKSTMMGEAPKDIGAALGMKLGLVVINGAMLTPMHMMGFGVPKHHEDHSSMVFTDPFFMVTDEGKRLCEYDGGILLVDEADKCDVDVKKILGEGALSGRFGPHLLPPGWVVWTAGNRASDRSGSTKELDHLINRRMLLEVMDDLKSWMSWADVNGVHYTAQSFVEQYPQVVFTEGVPEKQGPWCTPRSFVLADRHLSVLRKHFGETPTDEVTQAEVAGLIGQGASAQFFAHLKLDREMPKVSEIIANPTGVRVPGSDAPDARMLVCYQLAHQVTKETVEPIIKYIERLPDSFAVTFARAACTRQPLLSMAPAMFKWTQAHSALLNAMNALQPAR